VSAIPGCTKDARSLVRPGPELRAALEEQPGRRRADPIRRGLEGERTLGARRLRGARRRPGRARLYGPGARRGGHGSALLRRFDQAASLRATTTLIQSAGRTVADLTRAGESDDLQIPFRAVITRIAVPSLNRALYARDELRARLDLARLALAAEAWRSAHGSDPGGPRESWSASDRSIRSAERRTVMSRPPTASA
jgi:hypothetical protein